MSESNSEIQTLLLFHCSQSLRYIDVLQDLVNSYNNTYHRSIGRAPATVSLLNVRTVRRKLYGEMNSTAPKKFKFRVGDHVRLSLRKRLFIKGYKMNWTKEIVQITHQLSRTSSRKTDRNNKKRSHTQLDS